MVSAVIFPLWFRYSKTSLYADHVMVSPTMSGPHEIHWPNFLQGPSRNGGPPKGDPPIDWAMTIALFLFPAIGGLLFGAPRLECMLAQMPVPWWNFGRKHHI